MKFTPTPKFLRFAQSSFKLLKINAYFRKTDSLSGALNSGSWTLVNSKLQDVPDLLSQIEYGLGQFSADSIKLVGKDILWWNAHIFNAAADEYIECKIELFLGDDPLNFADDIVYYFSGMVDKRTILPSESDDAISFAVDTADVLADRMLAEFITTRYYDSIIGGVVLLRVPGVVVLSTNTGTKPVAAGIHELSYDYNDGSPQIRFDDGLWTAISADGEYDVTNATDKAAATQLLRINVKYSQLPRDTENRVEKLILQSSPQALPSTWYSGISLRGILRAMYTTMGITNRTFNLPQIPTWDGNRRMSMLEYVADTDAYKGVSRAICRAQFGLEIYVANASRVYRMSIDTGDVTSVCAVTAGHTISKLLYDSLLNCVWILHGNSAATSYGGYLARYDIPSNEFQASISVPDARWFNLELFRFGYVSGGMEYCLLYPNNDNGAIMRVDGLTMAVTTLFTRAALGYTGSFGPIWNYAYQGVRGSEIYYRFQVITGSGNGVHEIKFNTESGSSWQDAGITGINLQFPHRFGAFDSVNNNVYGYDASQNKVRGYSADDGAPFDVWTLQENDEIDGLYHNGEGLYFTTAMDRQVRRYDGDLIEAYGIMAYTTGCAFVTISGTVYGVDHVGRIFQIASTIELFLGVSDFSGRTIKNALTDALRACNCVGTISAAKMAIVYSRGTPDGDPITSGHTIDINVSNAEDIEVDHQSGQGFDLIEIDNGELKMNFNGTDYNVMPASLSERILKIQNTLIHSSVIKDYLKMFHQYFKTSRVLYTFPILHAMYHIEPMDGANVSFATTKIQVAATDKPIYNVTYSCDGKMKVGVLI